MKTAKQSAREASELWRACLTDGSLDEARARAVVDGIIASNRSGAQAVLKRFVRLLRLDNVRRTAIVTSAAPLDARLRAEVERDLARMHGPGLATEFFVDPVLIGGMRVQVGNDVYDGSVRASLAELESRF
jgi:F-type H+-transporting ATPase subunit delta